MRIKKVLRLHHLCLAQVRLQKAWDQKYIKPGGPFTGGRKLSPQPLTHKCEGLLVSQQPKLLPHGETCDIHIEVTAQNCRNGRSANSVHGHVQKFLIQLLVTRTITWVSIDRNGSQFHGPKAHHGLDKAGGVKCCDWHMRHWSVDFCSGEYGYPGCVSAE